MRRMSTEHTSTYPKKIVWKCSCGHNNLFSDLICSSCGKTEIMSNYSNPCDRCGLCGEKVKTTITCDWLVRNIVRY